MNNFKLDVYGYHVFMDKTTKNECIKNIDEITENCFFRSIVSMSTSATSKSKLDWYLLLKDEISESTIVKITNFLNN